MRELCGWFEWTIRIFFSRVNGSDLLVFSLFKEFFLGLEPILFMVAVNTTTSFPKLIGAFGYLLVGYFWRRCGRWSFFLFCGCSHQSASFLWQSACISSQADACMYLAADGISPEPTIMFRSFTDAVNGLKNEPCGMDWLRLTVKS